MPQNASFYDRLNAYLSRELPKGKEGALGRSVRHHSGSNPVYELALPSGQKILLSMDSEHALWFEVRLGDSDVLVTIHGNYTNAEEEALEHLLDKAGL